MYLKRLLFLFAFAFIVLWSNAQVFETKGTFIVTEPKEGLKIKDCSVCVEDMYVEMRIFDNEVVVPVLEREHVNLDGICGDVAYLDEDRGSYIMYGYREGLKVCIVSVVSIGERWTFSRFVHE